MIIKKPTLGFDEQISLCDYIFAELFHRVIGLSATFFDKIYLSKAASSYDLYQVEVFETDFLCWLEKVLAVTSLRFVLF